MKPTVRLWSAYLAITACVGLAYLLGPGWINVGPAFNLIGASAALAIAWGARRNLRGGRLPWYLVAAGQLLFVSGDVLAYNYERIFGRELSFPSIADPAYLAVYPCLIAALLMLIHRRDPTRDRSSLIDSLIVTIGVGTVSWVYLMAPNAHDESMSPATKLISIAYPLMDLLVLAVVVRLAVGAGRRGLSFALLALGLCALLATDSVYGWLLLHGGYATGGLLDGGWIAFYALLGAAALHPSMRLMSEPSPEPRAPAGRQRLIVLVCATLLAPGVEALRIVLDQPRETAVITGASAALFLLVMLRMAGLVRQQERAREREAALRRAAATLMTATSSEATHAATLAAARALADTGEVALYVTAGEGRFVAVTATGDTAPERALGVLSAEVRRRLLERRTVQADAGLRFGIPAGGELHAVIAVPERFVTDDARSALEALAREATLALEAVTLTERTARRRSEERFSSLVRHASDIVAILGADGSIRYVSQSVRRVLGYDADTVVGTQLVDYVHPDDQAHVLAILAETAGQDPARPVELELRARDAAGEWHHLETLATNLTGDPSVAGVVINARDVSDRKAFERQLSHDALHDRLTGLANRALFFDRLAQALAHKQRVASCSAVLFLDLDDFKGVNDGLGHAGGDEVLREVARRISRCIRASDSAARLGGDEFAVLLNDVKGGVHAADVAERIMRAIGEPILLEGHEVLVHASVGIALHGDGEHAIGADAILSNADAAMYLAKGRGKGCYHVFEAAMHHAAVQRLRLKADLRRALDEGELFVEYQPIVRLDGEQISGVEALVRWQHPERGIVPPGEFIPLAEESGHIVQLGEFVLRTACRDVGALHAIDPSAPPLMVSVNISARELQQRQIVDTVAHALEESGFPPASLVMELTESVMMHDMDLAVDRMQELRTLGVRLAIDDFGTGYSSLNYVRKFPIDLLKIDRSFIQDVSENGEISALTASIVELAQILKLEPVAEGIENADQLARLRELNCTFGQGYHLHRPMRIDAVEALLRSRAAAHVTD